MVQHPDANLPHFGPESRMVRDPRVGTFHAETQYHGRSISQKRTFHANAPYHGWFSIQTRTFHAKGQYRGRFDDQSWTFHVNAPFRGWVHSPGPNLPR